MEVRLDAAVSRLPRWKETVELRTWTAQETPCLLYTSVPEVKAAYVPAARDGCAGIKATIGVRTAVGNDFSVNNLHFINTDGGWMRAGAEAEQPRELEAPKAP